MYRFRVQTYIQTSFLLTAGAVGIAAVFFARLVNYIQSGYFANFQNHPYIMTALTPLFFLAASAAVVKASPEARGSGIPQVLEAIELAQNPEVDATSSRLVSIRTAVVKVISTAVGLVGGASVGREGPTVQIASSIFAWMAKNSRKYFPSLDEQSYLIAGGAAGVAAAFNTPLAGITFALEEIAEATFSQFKNTVMLSVIIAGITAQALVGDYLYFGQPALAKPSLLVIPEAIVIGALCGLAGSLFARSLATPWNYVKRITWWQRALACGIICAVIGYFSQGATGGSGYEIVKNFMDGPDATLPMYFGAAKFFTTVLSYLSGMAGGIFSPCLSIGAGLGYALGKLAFVTNLKVCALIGMVSFFAGAVGAPLTSVIIVMEMTNEHALIIPFMIGAFLAQRVARIYMPVSLYHYLAFGASGRRHE